MPYLGIFGLEFKKAVVMYEISTFEFLKTESLTHVVNFGVGSAFSEYAGPGLGPLYKVCQSDQTKVQKPIKANYCHSSQSLCN